MQRFDVKKTATEPRDLYQRYAGQDGTTIIERITIILKWHLTNHIQDGAANYKLQVGRFVRLRNTYLNSENGGDHLSRVRAWFIAVKDFLNSNKQLLMDHTSLTFGQLDEAIEQLALESVESPVGYVNESVPRTVGLITDAIMDSLYAGRA
jgi:hypothetical protein